MFLERLSAIQGRIDGAIALSLVDRDGIPVESVNSSPDLDLEVLAAEMLAQVRLVSDHNRELAVGDVEPAQLGGVGAALDLPALNR